MKRVIAGAGIALASTCAAAADTGELWEVSTQMEMAGLPAGMGARTARVCNETGDPRRQAQAGDLQKCKITDYKQSGNKVNMTLACPEGTTWISTAASAFNSSAVKLATNAAVVGTLV